MTGHVPTFQEYKRDVYPVLTGSEREKDSRALQDYRKLYGTANDQGWWFPGYTRGKAHWADESGRSLCLKWASFGVPAEAFENDGGKRVTSDECKECRRRLDKRRGVTS